MKISCDIIKDILPLYVDNVVSEDTRNLVSEHLEHCQDCRKKHEGMKEQVTIPVEQSAKPLKAFKRAWKRKKVLHVCATAFITIAVICCLLFVLTRADFSQRIAVNGAVYTQKGDYITELPAGSTELGYLRGISHNSASDPIEDFSATNLHEKYCGCPIYQSGDQEQVIYLEDYGGFYIPFARTKYITPPEGA